MSVIRMRALQPFRLRPGGRWIAKGAVLDFPSEKARMMQKLGNVEPLTALTEEELEQVEGGWYPKEDATVKDPCSPCGKKKGGEDERHSLSVGDHPEVR